MPVEGRALTSGCLRRNRGWVIGDEPANTVVNRTFPTGLYDAAKAVSVCFIVKPVGEPDAGNPHVRFDERGRETERRFYRYRARPRLYRRRRRTAERAGFQPRRYVTL